MRVHRLVMPIVLVVILLGSVQIGKALGYWQTSGKEMADLIDLKAADIKGWMTLEQVATGVKIPLPKLLELLGLPADTAGATPMKDLEDLIDVDTARTRIGDYLGQPTSAESGSEPTQAAPTTAAATPMASATPAGTPKSEATRTPAPAGQLAPADIKGGMTLKEVSDGTGVPLDKLLAEAKLPADTPPGTLLKDLATIVPGFEIQTLRDAATKLLGQ